MFKNCVNLPHFTNTETNYKRAYEGTKDGKVGYFVDGTSQTVYLLNRGTDNDSIIKNYRQAKTVTFTHTQPSTYEEFIPIDTEREGWVKAYKIKDGDGYKVEIYSAYQIYSRATSLASIFKNFTNLTTVDFGDLDTSNSESLVGMFSGCSALQNVTLNFNTANVTTFGWMFDKGCTSLTKVALGDNFVVNKSATLTSMFSGCTSLETIEVKAGTDWSSNTGDSNEMFLYCMKLPGFVFSVTNNSRAYAGKKGDIQGYFTERNSVASYNLMNRGNDNDSIIKQYRNAKSVAFSNTIPTKFSDSTIVDSAHYGSVKAYKVDNADGSYNVIIAAQQQISSGATSLASMFKGFENLTSVDFGNLDTSKATTLIGMFSGCKSLTTVNINFNTSNVSDFRWMFDKGCNALTTVEFGSNTSVSSSAQLAYMFQDCISLNKLIVKNQSHWGDTTGDTTGMFQNCTKLPGYSASATNNSRCYAGTRNGVTGYFYSASAPSNQNNNNPSLNNNAGNINNGDNSGELQNPKENEPSAIDDIK